MIYDRITGKRVTIVGASTMPRCVVIRHRDGTTQIQFRSMLTETKPVRK